MFAICNNLGGHSTCVFRNINIALVNKITVNQKVSYKAFIFEIGSHILTKTNKIVDRQKVVQASVMGEHKLRIKKSVLSNLAKRRVESERARLLQIDAIDYKREFPKAFK